MRSSRSLPVTAISVATFIFSFAAFGSSNFNNSYYIPHVYLSGYGGSNLLGNLDVLAPVYLKADRNLYIYGAANYAGAEESDQDNSWSAEFGAGYRQMFNWTGNQRIYGAYLLGSYNYSSYGNDFWVINPGIESLGQRWDYRINGYIPLNNSFSYQDFASNHGDDSHVNAHDNQTDDMLVTYYENIGYGADAEFGGRLFSVYHMPIKGYIDGYYYNVDSNNNSDDPSNIYGVGARITFQPTSYLSLEVKDTYDNDKANLFEVGAKIYFNGLRYGATNTHVDDQDLQVRLFDDIEHNFGTIDSGVSSFTRQSNTNPSSDDYNGGGGDDPVNPINPIEEHQVFYSADVASGGDGTAEHPYSASELDQGTIDTSYATWDDAQFVLASGSESSYAPGSIEMYDGTSMVGKTSNYTALATGSDLPTVYGALTLDGNNTIDSIILLNDTKTAATTGITVAANAKNVVIENSTIGSSTNTAGSYYLTGININSGADVTINSSSVYGYSPDSSAVGISSTGAELEMTNSDVYARADEGFYANAVGIKSSDSDITLMNTNVSASSTYGSVTGLSLTAINDDHNDISITGGKIEATNTGTSSKSIFYGINISGAENLTLNNGVEIIANNSSSTTNGAMGIYKTGAGTIVINDADITASSYYSVGSYDTVGIVMNGGTLYVHELSISASGFYVEGIRLDSSSAYFEPTASGEDYPISISIAGQSGDYGIYTSSNSTLDFSNAEASSISIVNTLNNKKGYGIYSKGAANGYDSNYFYYSGFGTNTNITS